MHIFRTTSTFCLSFALLQCVTMALAASDDPANYVTWRGGLASSAQPNAAYLKRVKALGVDIVTILHHPSTMKPCRMRVPSSRRKAWFI